MDTPIAPSIFGFTARNEFTERVGNFIMESCRGRRDVEIEIKLGTQHSAGPAGPGAARIRLPSLTEMILPADFPKGPFTSTLTKVSCSCWRRRRCRWLGYPHPVPSYNLPGS
jgi:hypothetical protein